VVFDFDGVVLDSEEPDYLAWRQIWSELGQTLPLGQWARCIGTGQGAATFDPFAELVELVERDGGAGAAQEAGGGGTELRESEVRARGRAIAAELMADRQPLPGVAAWLEECAVAGLAVGMASSSPRRWVRSHLERLGLAGHFPVICCLDDCGTTKPDPASYLLACSRLGVAPAGALAVEDSRNGLLAAKSAGLHCLVVPNVMTAHMDFTEADMVLGSLGEAGPLQVIDLLGT
jgi:HAD superfamily hydrolase (TIGR01509 family)